MSALLARPRLDQPVLRPTSARGVLNPTAPFRSALSLLWVPAITGSDPVWLTDGTLGSSLDGAYAIPTVYPTQIGPSGVFTSQMGLMYTGAGITWPVPQVGSLAVWAYNAQASNNLTQNYLFTALAVASYPTGPAFTLGYAGGTLYAGWIVGTDDRLTLATVFPAGWHHYVVTWSSASTVLYIDGIQHASRGATTTGNTAAGGAGSEVGLGALKFGSSAADQSWGYLMSGNAIADLRVYTRQLTINDARYLYAPQTRWSLYAPMIRPPFLANVPGAAATGNPWYAYAQMRG